MKKLLLALTMTISFGFVASAQSNTDGFVNWNANNDNMDRTSDSGVDFNLPGSHGTGSDYNSTPLGSGLIILTALGAGYMVSKRNKE